MALTDGNGFKTVKEINKYLSYNVANIPQYDKIGTTKELTVSDIEQLKHTRDYLNHIYKKYTQILRNDTYKP